MIDQDDIQGPDRWGGNRARSRWRWWAVGLAGVTGLALPGTIVAKNRPDNCVGVPGCAG
ncbi:hypothetical protein [Salinispora arenicola]|uniref:Uncharacterized protein n=1 Tax=Salinispora arenicola TaxID=168697 RepID=A0A542XME2_SALAC|nr:hypothetical protein [Salinispora arenicola]TQL36970.1 hypothetical protein FB564_2111 [Salinispora arenicola]GIM81825.1 hypothetical protein Sar04_04030 [Salinispora arenicola]